MKQRINILVLLFSTVLFSQSIVVDDTLYSETDLVNLLLSGSCVEASNILSSSSESVAYFNQNGSTFPISEGVIIRSGIAAYTQGNYTDTNLSSQLNSNSDPFLENISTSTGQNANITDTAFLQFDFTPISSEFSFDFIFASNEYGQWQCGFSDVFAFIITDLNTNVSTNLAVVPSSTIPVSVSTIRDNAYNPSCTSENENLFDTYTPTNPLNAALNMRGYTTVLNASTTLTPNTPYQIKLVIGDYNNPDYDSAVFIDAGTFSTPLNLGEDITLCQGNSSTISTALDETDFSHVWTLNGNVILGETTNSITLTQTGIYEVTATKTGTSCTLTDSVIVNDLIINSTIDLALCDTGSASYSYNLTENNTSILGIDADVYNLFYYASLIDIDSNTSINNITNYDSPGNETIYIKLYNIISDSFCDVILEFELILTPATEATIPDNIEICDPGSIEIIDLSIQDNQILNGLSPSQYTLNYFSSLNDALNNQNVLANNLYTVSSGNNIETIWVFLQNNSNLDCFDIISFDIIINPLPEVSQIADVLECSNYVLPPIVNGNYYTDPNATGTMLNSGDVIDVNGLYYIFIGPDENGCTNETFFNAVFIDEYTIALNHCENFTIPTPPAGDFYTAIDGPSGTGSIIPAGTILSTSQIIYYYAEIDGILCRNEAFPITIFPLPPVDELEDVVTCVSYSLQSLTNGDYYSTPGGTNPITDTTLTNSQTVYIFNGPDVNGCINESSFIVSIINNSQPVTACGSYTLPSLSTGNYYTMPSGQGNLIPFGTIITTSQTVYIYAETSTAPNCTDSFSFDITIVPIPTVDTLPDVQNCIDDPYILPVIINGDYFDGSGRTGNQYNSGDSINFNSTIYINNLINGCDNESSFQIDILPLPPIDNFIDVYSCDPYTLPTPTNGTYYTEPNGTGTAINSGTIITETQTLYLYNAQPSLNTCASQIVFTINIDDVDVGDFNNITACDSYTLPVLETGDYYTETGGIGLIMPNNYIYNNPGTYTIFVYTINGVRATCFDEESFTITISETPIINDIPNQTVCESYTLPDLDNSNFNIGYYTEPNGVGLISPSNYNIDTIGEQIIYIYATAFNNVNCFAQESFNLNIYPLLDFFVEDGIICVDPITNETIQPILLESGVSANGFTINWYLNGVLVHTGANYLATEIGTYTIETIKLAPDSPPECNYNSTTVNVTRSSIAEAIVHVSDYFEQYATIEVEIISGYGDYEYQLDNGPFQSSNIFYNVSSGEHSITIRDTLNNCGNTILTTTVINYPKFFTPNGDGFNDTWNIWDLDFQPNAKIYIFDRYGKFIKQLSPIDAGWDGTYNGENLFASDYWFLVKYIGLNNQEKEFRAHFSLKR